MYVAGRVGEVFAPFNVYLDEDSFNGLGKLCVLWGQYEFLTELAIYHVQGLTFEEGRSVDLPHDTSKRITKLIALAGDHLKRRERKERTPPVRAAFR